LHNKKHIETRKKPIRDRFALPNRGESVPTAVRTSSSRRRPGPLGYRRRPKRSRLSSGWRE
jgi:hypothetical protein